MIPILDEHYEACDLAKDAERPVDALSAEELGLFFEQLKKCRNQAYYPLALTQFSLGLRIGEACGLFWDALDFKSHTARIERTIVWDQKTWKPSLKLRPKNGKVRFLAMPEFLMQELEWLKANRDRSVEFVFHRKGQLLNRKSIADVYNRAMRRIGIKHMSGTHILRKTSATQATEATGDFYAVSNLLGHSSPNITLRYVAHTNAQKTKVAAALNGVLLGLQNGASVPQCPASGERLKLFVVKSNQ